MSYEYSKELRRDTLSLNFFLKVECLKCIGGGFHVRQFKSVAPATIRVIQTAWSFIGFINWSHGILTVSFLSTINF